MKKIILGIYCPTFLIANHNTDHKINLDFKKVNQFSNLETKFIANFLYSFSFNFNKVIFKILKINLKFLIHKLKKNKDFNLIYHYGIPINHSFFYDLIKNIPCIVTAGFSTDSHLISILGFLPDRNIEAKLLALKLEKASLIHFHTINGRERFLSYCPEFIDRSVSIPFLLPALDKIDTIIEKDNSFVSILYVGYQGEIKGLPELILALNNIDINFLNFHKVEINIVSKYKPDPILNLKINWWPKLSNKKILTLMKRAHIFILVSPRDSYGLVLIEAMAHSCAIITDNDQTRQEIIGDSGICIFPNNVKILKNTIVELVENKNFTREIGIKAFNRFIENFSPKIVGKMYEDAFEKLI
jgi:glycosyltransferase involved in cell wall biosynthesis